MAALPGGAAGKAGAGAAHGPRSDVRPDETRQFRSVVSVASDRDTEPVSARDAGPRAVPDVAGTAQIPASPVRGSDEDRLGQGRGQAHLRTRQAPLSHGRHQYARSDRPGVIPRSGEAGHYNRDESLSPW